MGQNTRIIIAWAHRVKTSEILNYYQHWGEVMIIEHRLQIRQNAVSPGRKCHANVGDDNTFNKRGSARKEPFSHVFELSALSFFCVFLYFLIHMFILKTTIGPGNAYCTAQISIK